MGLFSCVDAQEVSGWTYCNPQLANSTVAGRAPPYGRTSCFPRWPFSKDRRPGILPREASSHRLCVRGLPKGTITWKWSHPGPSSLRDPAPSASMWNKAWFDFATPLTADDPLVQSVMHICSQLSNNTKQSSIHLLPPLELTSGCRRLPSQTTFTSSLPEGPSLTQEPDWSTSDHDAWFQERIVDLCRVPSFPATSNLSHRLPLGPPLSPVGLLIMLKA